MRLGFGIALAVVFVFSALDGSRAGVLIAMLLAVFVLWPDGRRSREEREQAARDQRVQAALEALRALGRDYPRPKNY